MCLFSEAFKRNLLCFLHFIHPGVPRDHILHLLQCLTQDHRDKQWSSVLTKQLYRAIEGTWKETLLTTKCTEGLRGLCERFRDQNAKGRWASCFQDIETERPDQTVLCQKKRKSDNLDRDVEDEDEAQQSKKVKRDVCTAKDEEERLTEDLVESEMRTQLNRSVASKSQTSSHQSSKVLPDNIKVNFLDCIIQHIQSIKSSNHFHCHFIKDFFLRVNL